MFLLSNAADGAGRRLSLRGRADVSRDLRRWRGDGWELTHGLHQTRQADQWDDQPLLGGDGRFVLAGDIYLTRRRDFAQALGLPTPDLAETADSTLVTRAWEKWGRGAVERLHGWYAFVVFDREDRSVTVVTDRVGHRAAYYCVSDGVISIGSSLPDLLASPDVPRDLDPRYLAGIVAEYIYFDAETPYRAIRRVPWATILTIESGGSVRSDRYWRLDPSKRVTLAKDDDYVDAARELIDRAVLAAMPEQGPIASTLSSGFDSASVVWSASRQANGRPVHAFTLAPADDERQSGAPPVDEGPAASRHAARWLGVEHHVLKSPLRADDMWTTPERWFLASGVPIRNADAFPSYVAAMEATRNLGGTVLLNGNGGDNNFSYDGLRALCTWLRQGKVAKVAREAFLIPPDASPAFWPRMTTGVWRYVVRPFTPDWLRTLAQWVRGRRAVPWLRLNTLLSMDANKQFGIDTWQSALGAPRYWEAHTDARLSMAEKYYISRGDVADVRAAHRRLHGVDHRPALFDPDLMQFCLSIPLDQHLKGGRTRWLGERVLREALPKESLRVRKHYRQGGDRVAYLKANRQHLLDSFEAIKDSSLARELIDLPRVRKLLEAWPKDDDPQGFNRAGYGRPIQQTLLMGRFIRWAEGGNR